MQKVFLFLVAIFISGTVSAQTDRASKISYTTTVGTGIPMNDPSSTPFIWQATAHYKITGRFSAGTGTGLSFYEEMLIPLYGDIRYQIGRERKFTPGAGLAAGYSFAAESDVNGGFFLNPSFTVTYPLKKNMKVLFAVGYELQELERLKKHTDGYFSKEFSELLRHHSISFKIGFQF